MQHVFAPQGVSLVSCWQPGEGFVEPCPLFVSKHAAIGLPLASILYLLSRAEGPLCRAMYGTNGWMKIPQHRHLDHFVPRHQEVVIVEVECTFRGFPWARAAVKGKERTTRPCRWLHMFWTSVVGPLGKEAFGDGS